MSRQFTSNFSVLVAALTVASSAAAAPPPTADQLLDLMDKNMTFDSRTAHLTMTVEGRRTRSFEIISHARGQEDSVMEYVAPARDKGTKMLKLGDELWIYLPNVDRVQKISGHMLRQGMMGSDLSYEDLMASRDMRTRYEAKVVGEDQFDGRTCWKIEMKAKDNGVTYPKRVTWVDKESYIPLKQELFALSGMLIKTWTMTDVKTYAGGRQFPTKMVVEDHVKKESKTRIEFKDIEFGVEHKKEIFSLRWLERR